MTKYSEQQQMYIERIWKARVMYFRRSMLLTHKLRTLLLNSPMPDIHILNSSENPGEQRLGQDQEEKAFNTP